MKTENTTKCGTRDPRFNFHVLSNTVTHRTAIAPYLATKSVHQLADAEETWYPKTVAVYKSDFYVDDFKEACDLRDQLIELFWKNDFELRQWSSNNSYVVSSIIIPCEDTHIPITLDKATKILGLYWLVIARLHVICNKSFKQLTKRIILARIA